MIQFMHGCVHCAIERACVLSAPDIFEPNRNFDVVLLDAEEYDGRSESAFSDYSCHLFFSFILAKKKKKRTDDTFEGASRKKTDRY